MQRLFVAIALFLLVNSPLVAQKTDLERNDLVGPVKTLTVLIMATAQQNAQSQPKQLSEQRFKFDLAGRVIEQEHFGSTGELWSRDVHSYDSKGTKLATSKFKADGKLEFLVKYEYDKDRRVSSSSTYDGAGKLSSRATNRYDDRGLLIEGTHARADGSLMNKSIFTYDSRDRLIEFAVYDSDGRLWQKQTISNEQNDMTITHAGRTTREIGDVPAKEGVDEHGNWLKSTRRKVVIDSGKSSEFVEVIIRRITYYQ